LNGNGDTGVREERLKACENSSSNEEDQLAKPVNMHVMAHTVMAYADSVIIATEMKTSRNGNSDGNAIEILFTDVGDSVIRREAPITKACDEESLEEEHSQTCGVRDDEPDNL
jgi:hypothetical protein